MTDSQNYLGGSYEIPMAVFIRRRLYTTNNSSIISLPATATSVVRPHSFTNGCADLVAYNFHSGNVFVIQYVYVTASKIGITFH